MRLLDYNYGTASGYVLPYPLQSNIALSYPVLFYAAPVGQDFHSALLNDTVNGSVSFGMPISLTLPVTGGDYVYVTAPSFINLSTVYFNGFPIALVPVELNANYNLSGLNTLFTGVNTLFNTYRFPNPQNGINFTIMAGQQ